MRTDFTTLRADLAQNISSLQEGMKGLFRTLNTQREGLLAIYRDMHDTVADLAEFSAIVEETSDALAVIADASLETAEKSAEVVNFISEIPTCDFEKFVDFCDVCGDSIEMDSEYEEEVGGWFVCADCAHAEDVAPLIPTETDDPAEEEMPVELAETIAE